RRQLSCTEPDALQITRNNLTGAFQHSLLHRGRLVFGKLGAHQFNDESLRHPALQQLMSKISVSILPEFSNQEQFQKAHDAGKAYTTIVITHGSGRVCRMQRNHQKGFPDSPLSAQDFHTKFMDCLSNGYALEAGERTWNALMQIEHVEIFKPV